MNLPVFIGLTLVLFGLAAYMMGQAIAITWRPLRQVFLYALLLGAGDRFLVFALFDGELASLGGYLIDTTAITLIGLLAFRITRVNRMVSQYPWLYRRSGLFGWEEINK
ncbi:DUF6867 family protein [Sedimenticola selenatireducens]|uniref:DUF6867 domain-containing protein n=1 Tax=Sedimenticola selenatireducens TaxID=191960 RepID=A0A2N6D0I9_9GAMM|nr:hypothetical protein [Sedimenticola selenatireducens]PLX63177.1 MAG: hypothetical protein C0630_03215 [Sedimenticola selenatireducens]